MSAGADAPRSAASGLALVTGASGFVGGALVRRLLAEGRRVRALARSPLAELAAAGAQTVRGDVADAAAMAAACAGVSTVFHAAAKVGAWGPREEFERTNIGGAQAVVRACVECGVERLVFTSSPSVVFNGRDLAGAGETQPLGTRFPCDYPRTKAEAERIVLAAHRPGRLATVALRPHLVFGPGDRNLVPRVVSLARAGRLRIVGSGRNRVDLTHIDNVADAHLLAERALGPAGGPAGGRAYFVTNGEPVVLWEWIGDVLRRVGAPPVQGRVHAGAAYAAGAACEAAWRVLGLPGEPPMTRFVASALAREHWFDIGAARRDLGYAPRVSMAEGTRRLVEELRGSA